MDAVLNSKSSNKVPGKTARNSKKKTFFLYYKKGRYILENISLKKKGHQQKPYYSICYSNGRGPYL
jgi:hypothetical protein